jgi:hypothetical protein
LQQAHSFFNRTVRQAGAQASPMLEDVLRKSSIASRLMRL